MSDKNGETQQEEESSTDLVETPSEQRERWKVVRCEPCDPEELEYELSDWASRAQEARWAIKYGVDNIDFYCEERPYISEVHKRMLLERFQSEGISALEVKIKNVEAGMVDMALLLGIKLRLMAAKSNEKLSEREQSILDFLNEVIERNGEIDWNVNG